MKTFKNMVTTFFIILLTVIPTIFFCFALFYDWEILVKCICAIAIYMGLMIQVYAIYPTIEKAE